MNNLRIKDIVKEKELAGEILERINALLLEFHERSAGDGFITSIDIDYEFYEEGIRLLTNLGVSYDQGKDEIQIGSA